MSKKDNFREIVLKCIKKKRINSYKKDKILVNNLKNIIRKDSYKSIMLYIPLKSEVDIKPLIKDLRAKGIQLYVPFMEDKSFRLVKYRLPLQKKRFGIKEPKFSNLKIKKIDLAIVPIIGIDKSCKRVGFGKGMYDRFFEKNSKIIKQTLFIQRDLYYCNSFITDIYDISANSIISSSIKFIEI
jgi:5-formyltetrahydrofolate cyclo-ligase